MLRSLQILRKFGSGSPAVTNLVSGYKQFYKEYFVKNKELYATLQSGQAPKSILVGCCDSRVDPAQITKCDPGDIFVVRNVANLIPAYSPDASHHGTSSALEFAVKVLKVENIIVLGHSKCGGINAMMTDATSEFEFLGNWMQIAEKAKIETIEKYGNLSKDAQCMQCERISILHSLENLLTYPWIHKKLQDGTINVVGWHFDFETGELTSYNSETKDFEVIADMKTISSNKMT